jgi:hypothetical protein
MNQDLSKVASLVPVPCAVILKHADAIIARIDAAEAAAHEAAIDSILERSGKKGALLMTKTDDRAEAIAAYNQMGRPNFFWEDWIGQKEPSYRNDGPVVTTEERAYALYLMYGRYSPNAYFFAGYGGSVEGRYRWSCPRSETSERYERHVSTLRALKQKAENAVRLDLAEVHVDRKLYDEMLSLAQRYAVKVETPVDS